VQPPAVVAALFGVWRHYIFLNPTQKSKELPAAVPIKSGLAALAGLDTGRQLERAFAAKPLQMKYL
jgi:hypothetical protein